MNHLFSRRACKLVSFPVDLGIMSKHICPCSVQWSTKVLVAMDSQRRIDPSLLGSNKIAEG